MAVKIGLAVKEVKTKDKRGKTRTDKISNLAQNIDLSGINLKKYQDK